MITSLCDGQADHHTTNKTVCWLVWCAVVQEMGRHDDLWSLLTGVVCGCSGDGSTWWPVVVVLHGRWVCDWPAAVAQDEGQGTGWKHQGEVWPHTVSEASAVGISTFLHTLAGVLCIVAGSVYVNLCLFMLYLANCRQLSAFINSGLFV